jgi:hypothetical protein
MAYDGFLSYSHAADGQLAPAAAGPATAGQAVEQSSGVTDLS